MPEMIFRDRRQQQGLTLSSAIAIAAFAFLAAAFLSSPSRASAADLSELSIEELLEVRVTGASRYEQKSKDAPSSVTVITASEIRRFGYRTLIEILNSVRGFYSTYDRNYHYAGVRGFSRPGDYNTRFLLLLDGIRVNDNVYDQAPVGTDFPLDVDLIDRVEIIRGPSSSLYGTNAFFGVINVITKRGRDMKGAEIAGSAGSLKTYHGRLSLGAALEKSFELLASGTIFDSNGRHELFYGEFNDTARNSDDDHSGSAFLKTSYRDFTLEAAYIKRSKKIPTAPFETFFGDPRTMTTDERALIDLKYEKSIVPGLDIMSRIFYGYYDYDGDYVYDDGLPAGPSSLIVTKDVGRGRWWGGEVQLTKMILKHRIVAGAEIMMNFRQDQKLFDTAVYLDDRRDLENWAVYGQAELSILDNLTLYSGVRYDNYEEFGGTVNPRLGLIFSPAKNTFLKFLAGRAFRAPNTYELYYNDLGALSPTQKPALDLRPETINTYELVAEQFFSGNLKATVSIYSYTIHNLISQTLDADGLIVFRNAGRNNARGIEAEIEKKWDTGMQARISYAFQRVEDMDSGSALTNSPAHLAKLNLIAPLIKRRVFLGLEELFASSRKTLGGERTDDAFLTNLTLSSFNVVKGLDLSASIYNLFNRSYAEPASSEHRQDAIRQNGRTFRVQAVYRF